MKNALFIWIPKTAGTSVQQALPMRRFVGDAKAMGRFNNEGFATFGHASIPALIDAGIMTREWYTNAFKFCIVRNPFDRAVSLYHHFLRRGKIGAGFKNFCQRIKNNRDTAGVYNYRGLSQAQPQVDWIPDDIDFVGRLEDLQGDIDIVCARLRLPLVKLGTANQSKRKGTAGYYDGETARIVADLYAEDFKRFDYKGDVNG